jgi:hypothetical protein
MKDERYRSAMEAIARDATMPAERAARLEQELLAAFTRQQAAGRSASTGRRTRAWRPWLAAAAAGVVIAGSAAAWRLRVVTANNVTERPMAEMTAVVAAPRVRAALPETPATMAATITRPRRAAASRTARHVAVVRPSGFVELPGAAALPAFESGAIVRMDVPVASLPAYGFDISAGAGDRAVEADVLIGQDGRARAMRLVGNTARSAQ